MSNSVAKKKLQHPPYLKFTEYLNTNGIGLQEVANVIGSKAAVVSRNNEGTTDYSYDEVMSLCNHFQISQELFSPKVGFDSTSEFEKTLRSIFRISYIEQTGHEPENLEEEYQAKMKRMEAREKQWKKEEQERLFEEGMNKEEDRRRKRQNASESYKMLGQHIWPHEAIETLNEIKEIDGDRDITWLMAQAFLYGTIEGIRKEREKKKARVLALEERKEA